MNLPSSVLRKYFPSAQFMVKAFRPLMDTAVVELPPPEVSSVQSSVFSEEQSGIGSLETENLKLKTALKLAIVGGPMSASLRSSTH